MLIVETSLTKKIVVLPLMLIVIWWSMNLAPQVPAMMVGVVNTMHVPTMEQQTMAIL